MAEWPGEVMTSLVCASVRVTSTLLASVVFVTAAEVACNVSGAGFWTAGGDGAVGVRRLRAEDLEVVAHQLVQGGSARLIGE